jgi:ASC-1-like (ASCH) protein
MSDREYFLTLSERAIKRGSKKVEVRANKNKSSVAKMEAGDVIVFTKIGTSEQLRCQIERITLYSTVRDLLLTEGIEPTLSSGKSLEDGITSIESISGYKQA